MKKIAVLAPEFHEPFIEGVQKSAFNVVLSMLGIGYGVDVFTQKTFGKDLAVSGASIFFRFSTFRIKPIKYFLWLFDSIKIIKHIINNKISEVIIFSFDLPFVFFLLLSKFFLKEMNIRLVVFSARELSGVSGFLFKIINSQINHFFVRSEYLKNLLLSLKIDDKKITTATVFVGKDKFIGFEKRCILKIKRIAYLSNTENSAGISTVLYLAKCFPDVDFILGIREFSSLENKQVISFLEKRKVFEIKNIKVVRNIPNMVQFYQEVDAVILPVIDCKNTMSAPLVLLEALASGCIIFANNIPVFREYSDFIILFDSQEQLRKILEQKSVDQIYGDLNKRKLFINSLLNEKEAAGIYFSKYE